MKYAIAVPIQSGKTDAAREWFKTILGPKREDWDEFQARQRVKHETYFIQSSPEGDMIIVSGEGEWIPPTEFLDPDNKEFDRWFIEQVKEINGVDIMEFGAQPPEVLGEWHARVPAK